MVDGLQFFVVADVQQLPELAVDFQRLVWGDQDLFLLLISESCDLSTGVMPIEMLSRESHSSTVCLRSGMIWKQDRSSDKAEALAMLALP